MRVRKKLFSLFSRYYPYSALIALSVIVCLTLWQTLGLYYWLDDWDLFLKVIHPELNLWNLGSGLFGRGPYKYLHTPFVFLYPLFGLHLPLYFATGLLLYFLAAVSIFFLVMRLTKNVLFAFGTAAIFGTICHIGLYSLTHLSNSYQMSLAIIGLCLTLIVFTFFLQTYKYRYYFATILIFALTIELVFIRVFGIFFLLFAMLLLFRPKRHKSLLQKWRVALLVLPFFGIFGVLYYLRLSGDPVQHSSSIGIAEQMTSFFRAFISIFQKEGGLANLISLFASFSNMIIPSSLSVFVHTMMEQVIRGPLAGLAVGTLLVGALSLLRVSKKLLIVAFIMNMLLFMFIQWALVQELQWRMTDIDSFLGALGGSLLIFFLFLILAKWRSDTLYAKMLLFGLVWVLGQFLSYFLHSPDSGYSGSDSRYFTTSTVGTSLLLASCIAMISRRKRVAFSILIVVVVSSNILYTNMLLFSIRKNTSVPTRAIYESLKRVVPVLPKNPLFLVTTENDPIIMRALQTSYFDSAVAIYYHLPGKPKVVGSFIELLALLKNTQSIKRIVAIRIQKDGTVKDYSDQLRHNLLRPSNPKQIKNVFSDDGIKNVMGLHLRSAKRIVDGTVVLTSPNINVPLQQLTLTPTELTISLTLSPSDLPANQSFFQDSQDSPFSEEACRHRPSILRIFSANSSFAGSLAAITPSSQLDHSPASNLVDGTSRSWASDPTHWGKTHKEEILLSFKNSIVHKRLFFSGAQGRFSPKELKVSTSLDGKDWIVGPSLRFSKLLNDYEISSVSLPKSIFSFIKIEIPATILDLPPSLGEIWTSPFDDAYYSLDVKRIALCPFCCTTSPGEANKILPEIGQNVIARVAWRTTRDDSFIVDELSYLRLIPDGEKHVYKILLPAEGTMISDVQLSKFQIPVDLTIENVSIRSLSLQEIKDIKE